PPPTSTLFPYTTLFRSKFGEALAKFQAFTKEFAASPLKDDALLRAGFCLVQTKQFDDAARTLQPLVQQSQRLADQAYYWLGKAQDRKSTRLNSSHRTIS